MQAQTFVLTAVAAVVTTVAALLTHSVANRFAEPATSGAKLVPGLATGNAKIGTVVIGRGGETLTLKAVDEAGSRWGITERGGFPADPDRVRALLVKLAQAELLEAKTQNAARLSLLEVENPGKDAKSRSLRLLDPKGGVVADMIVGKRRFDAFGSGRAGTYVRRVGEGQAWLASLDVDPATDIKSWLKPALVEIESGKLAEVQITIPGEEPLTLKAADGKFALQGFPPEGRKLKDAGTADTLARSAGLIDFEDVRRVAATPAGEAAGNVTIVSQQGLNIVLTLRREGDAHWTTAVATGTGDAKAAADAFNARAAGWDFRLPTAKIDSLLKKRGDLLEPEKAG